MRIYLHIYFLHLAYLYVYLFTFSLWFFGTSGPYGPAFLNPLSLLIVFEHDIQLKHGRRSIFQNQHFDSDEHKIFWTVFCKLRAVQLAHVPLYNMYWDRSFTVRRCDWEFFFYS